MWSWESVCDNDERQVAYTKANKGVLFDSHTHREMKALSLLSLLTPSEYIKPPPNIELSLERLVCCVDIEPSSISTQAH